MGGGNDAAEAQAKRMKDEAKRAQAQAAQIQADNQRKADADKRRRMGRSLLVTNSGGELGVNDNLG